MPLVSPDTVHVVVAVEQVKPPGVEMAVYPVMADPPFDAGAVQATTDWVLALEVAVTAVGAPGVVAGIATAEAADTGPVPTPLPATTVNV